MVHIKSISPSNGIQSASTRAAQLRQTYISCVSIELIKSRAKNTTAFKTVRTAYEVEIDSCLCPNTDLWYNVCPFRLNCLAHRVSHCGLMTGPDNMA
jgi:hypothetical protein